MTATNLTSVA